MPKDTDVYGEIRAERARQIAKGRDAAHDDKRAPADWMRCLEEIFWNEKGRADRTTWLKVASVAVAAIQSVDRQLALPAGLVSLTVTNDYVVDLGAESRTFGWILQKGPERGQWVTVRKASEAEIAKGRQLARGDAQFEAFALLAKGRREKNERAIAEAGDRLALLGVPAPEIWAVPNHCAEHADCDDADAKADAERPPHPTPTRDA